MDELMDVVKLHAEDEMNLRSQAIMPAADAQVLMPMMNLDMAMKRLKEFQEFVKTYLIEGEDYGQIPGTPKPTLYKSGAEKLCDLYGMADSYVIESRIENYEATPPLFDYTFKCILTSRRDKSFIGEGFGSCNSYESKYKMRELKRKCPICQKEAIIKGKPEYGGGWVCWFKQGKSDGCGAKFVETDPQIADQKVGKEFNDDIPTIKNTILKMSKKRSKIDAVIAATRSSGIFSQDLDDIGVDGDTGGGTKAAADRVAERKLAEHAAKSQATPTAKTETRTAQAVPVTQAGDFNAAVAEADASRINSEVFGDANDDFAATDPNLPEGFIEEKINGVSKIVGKDKKFYDVTFGKEIVRYFINHDDDPTHKIFESQKGQFAVLKLSEKKGKYPANIRGILKIGTADLSKLEGNDAA